MYSFLLALIYLAFISLGLPASAARRGLAGHAYRTRRVRFVYGYYFHGDIRRNYSFKPFIG